ncbi:protein of unknown function [Halopseudomonas sabulinigri]|uniref:DUF4426 domain-containing protein n=1 Tax=Halopseudomonas sabulinigri TaxID=472181 RepID=A0A1H1URP5_9GAMM|nr:DUF4426 domain-containing protein [Halopseudomonas sabulinigri]SDS74539.1 protein of unknown function [Halopseudomonas sabulinigri]
MLRTLLFAVALLADPLLQAAAEPARFGDLIVYHNVFNSSLLQPEIAANAGLQRGPSQGVINIAVQRQENGKAQAVDAILKGEVRSLIGQPVKLDFKRIKEGDAIYFVANYSAAQRGVLLFKIDIQAAPGAMVHSLSFQQEFFPDDQ